MTKYVSGTNMPGYMPDAEPSEHDTFDEAKRAIIWCLKHEEECQDTEEESETIVAFAEEVNLQGDEFSAQCLGMVYWVTKA